MVVYEGMLLPQMNDYQCTVHGKQYIFFLAVRLQLTYLSASETQISTLFEIVSGLFKPYKYRAFINLPMQSIINGEVPINVNKLFSD